MELEIRPAKASEMEDFTHVVRTGFGFNDEFKLKLRPEWTLCAFSGGKLSTSYAAWPLTMQFLDTTIPVAGITMVGTLPAYRRRNQLRRVTETHFRLLHERNEQPVTALLASMAAIYQRYGYGVITSRNGYSVEPQHLRLISGCSVEGEFYEADDGDMETMLDLYHRFASKKVGYLLRGEAMRVVPGAAFTVLTSYPPALPPVRLIYKEQEEPKGYLIYSVVRDASQGNPMGQRISVHDLVWLSSSSYRAIWEMLSNMDIVARIDWGRVPPDDPLPHLMLEPRKLNVTSADGLLGRIVDVEKALPLRRYNGEGELIFEVVDELCSWNCGTWKMSYSSAGNEIKHTDERAQVVMPVSTLVMLMFGQLSASQAAAMGRLDVNEPGSVQEWDSAMRIPCRPFCADGF